MRTLYLYPRLFWENETTDRPDWLFLPLLRLTDEGSGPRPDPAYAPPSLYVEANPVLRGLARGLEARLAAAIRRLEPARRRGLDEPATSRQLLLVNAARTLSELRHALAWPGTAPHELFGLLRNGFAAAAACVGIATADAMPLYRHDDPAESFRSLDSLLREILRGLLPETAAVVRFRADGEFLRAELPRRSGPDTGPTFVLKPKKPFPPCSMRDALWPMLRTPSPPRWPRPSPESRCAKSPLRRACRNGMASTIWSPTPVRSAGRRRCVPEPSALPSSPCAARPYPVTFACFT